MNPNPHRNLSGKDSHVDPGEHSGVEVRLS